MFTEGIGWGAIFEIVEFFFDLLRPRFFPWLDSAQKGNTDTMFDLIADVSGLLVAFAVWVLFRVAYKFFRPNAARAEYLADRKELAAHQRADAEGLEKEYREELRKERALRRKKSKA